MGRQLTIHLTEEVFERVDAAASEKRISRSMVIEALVRVALDMGVEGIKFPGRPRKLEPEEKAFKELLDHGTAEDFYARYPHLKPKL